MSHLQTVRLLMLPGIGNSGPEHWQTLWASRQEHGRGFQPADWDRPDLPDWLQALDAAIDACSTPVVLVASSDDPYGSLEHARRMAMGWAAGCVEVGALGHINAASGVGAWDTGWHLLQAFGAGLRAQMPASN